MQKIWKIKDKIQKNIISQFTEVNPIILQVLDNRGLKTQAQIDEFLSPDYSHDIHDPFLFKDMNIAVNSILKSIEDREKILVYGDYDADGITSSVILYETLLKLGAKPEVYIPHREKEGYGLNLSVVDTLIEQRIDLVITVDCGITNIEETKKLMEGNTKVIIVDHHKPLDKLPGAIAIINPHLVTEEYPYRDLAGVGVTFKLVQGLLKKQNNSEINIEAFEKWFLDLVAIGTVADMCPLLGENRTLVKYGLVVMNKTQRPGLQALINTAKAKSGKLDTYSIGFQIAPRLNAAGRLDYASNSFNLLVSDDIKKINEFINSLNTTNENRQRLTEKVMKEALIQVEPDVGRKKLLFAIGDNWPVGILGLVAGRISDKFYLPTIVAGRFDHEIMGSGRSIEEFDITTAVLSASDYLSRFGGHPGACGFTLRGENMLEDFKRHMLTKASAELKKIDLRPKINIDAEIKFEDITWELFDGLQQLEPFGEENPKPKFVIKELKIVEITKVGDKYQHLKMQFIDPKSKLTKKAIGFNKSDFFEILDPKDIVDIVCEIIPNEWNSTRTLELKLIDMKKNEL